MRTQENHEVHIPVIDRLRSERYRHGELMHTVGLVAIEGAVLSAALVPYEHVAPAGFATIAGVTGVIGGIQRYMQTRR